MRNKNPAPQYFDDEGRVLLRAFMFYYESGSDTDLKPIFVDEELEVPSLNPVPLRGAGRLPNVFFEGETNQVLRDSNGNEIWSRDPVQLEEENGNFSDYDEMATYSENEVVLSDGTFYRSLTDNNNDNDPATSPTEWTPVYFVETWNPNVSYPDGEVVKTDDGYLWRSLEDNNLNNNPPLGSVWDIIGLDAWGYISNYTLIDGFGISVIQNVSNNARVVFERTADSSTDQTVFAKALESDRYYYVQAGALQADEVSVDATDLANAPLNADGDFIIMRVLKEV